MTQGKTIRCDQPGCPALLVMDTTRWMTIQLHAEKLGWYVGNTDLCPEHVWTSLDDRPHSRACGIHRHDHGPECSPDCPTCQEVG